MKLTHDVIHDGIYYVAGEEIPQPNPPVKTATEEQPKEAVEKPKRKRTK